MEAQSPLLPTDQPSGNLVPDTDAAPGTDALGNNDGTEPSPEQTDPVTILNPSEPV
jgi:hypothetical protein